MKFTTFDWFTNLAVWCLDLTGSSLTDLAFLLFAYKVLLIACHCVDAVLLTYFAVAATEARISRLNPPEFPE